MNNSQESLLLFIVVTIFFYEIKVNSLLIILCDSNDLIVRDTIDETIVVMFYMFIKYTPLLFQYRFHGCIRLIISLEGPRDT